MYISASDLKAFYSSDIGIIVQKILQRHISDFWPDTHGLRVMGCGYATPYLEPFSGNAERVFAMMPTKQGPEHWPKNKKNLVFWSCEDRMPIENCSIDRILMVHHLECCDNLQTSLREIWRVLKANGRLLIIVPNRMGVWARADWSPFGHGRPFTLSQVCSNLRDNLFVEEGHKSALFVPPVPDSPILMKSAGIIEKMGCNMLPFVAGVHMVEVSKKIFATIDGTGTGSAVLAKTKEILAGNGVPVPQGLSPNPKEK